MVLSVIYFALVRTQKIPVAIPKATMVPNFGQLPYNSPIKPPAIVPTNAIETAINILRTGDMGSSLVLIQFTRSFSVMAASLMVDAPAKAATDRAQKSIQTVY